MLVVGSITTLFMAMVAIVQNDIKRVVAYSTLSQLGYMTVALGVSAYSVAIFHLMTHAFFKAVLFLGAGSVIIAMHHEQDMRKMGGLEKVYAHYLLDHDNCRICKCRGSQVCLVFSQKTLLLRQFTLLIFPVQVLHIFAY